MGVFAGECGDCSACGGAYCGRAHAVEITGRRAALGVLYALFDMIPYFGPVLGAIPVVVIALIQGDCNLLLVFCSLCGTADRKLFSFAKRSLGIRWDCIPSV